MRDSPLDSDAPPPGPAARLALSPPAQPDATAGRAVAPAAARPEPGKALSHPCRPPQAKQRSRRRRRSLGRPRHRRRSGPTKADWQHYAAWCARSGFVPVPAEPATVGAYLASLAATHAPTTIRRRLAAIGLPWTSSHRDIQEPLRGLLRQYGRPVQKAAPLTLEMLRRLVATCDASARGRRDRALLLIGFTGALRRSELAALRVEDVTVAAGGLRVRIARGKTDPAGQGAEIGLPRGKHAGTCPVKALRDWQAVAKRKAGPLFRRISTAGRIGEGRCTLMRCGGSWRIGSGWRA